MQPTAPFPLPIMPMRVRIESLAALLGVLPERGGRRRRDGTARRHGGAPGSDAVTVTVAGARIDVAPDGSVQLVHLSPL